MNVNLVCIGTLKEKYLKNGVQEYKKRLKSFAKFNIIELKESKSKDNIEKVKKEESIKIKEVLSQNKGYNILLDVDGRSFSSQEFAKKFLDIYSYQNSTINFVIGGSNGLSEDYKNDYDLKLSFSNFTFPHQLMRVVFVEQLYRWFMINSNRTYDK